MFYMDTSVLVAYYCPEPLSDDVDAFITTHTDLAISNLTEVEFFSAISRKIREGSLDREKGSKITAKLLSHLQDSYFLRLPLVSYHYRLARDWIGQFSTALKTLDSLHLAIASAEGAALVTSDENLAKAANALSVDVVFLETPVREN